MTEELWPELEGAARAQQRVVAKKELRAKIQKITLASSVALFGGGVGLSLSVVFLAAGVVLLALAVVVALLGLAASFAVPEVLWFRRAVRARRWL